MGFASQRKLLLGASSSLGTEGWPGFPAQVPALLGARQSRPHATALGGGLRAGEQSGTKSSALPPPDHSSAVVENYKGRHSPKKPRHLFWFSKHFINVIDNTSRFLRLARFYF